MTEMILETLRSVLESETQTVTLLQLSADFYTRVSTYSQELRKSVGTGTSVAANRLISRQTRMIDSMTRQLLALRVEKASNQHTLLKLLPEERHVCSVQASFQKKFESFTEALSGGKPSFIDFARRADAERSVSVRFIKHVDELIGPDLRRYGPFEVDDVVSLPAISADILVSSGSAMDVCSRNEGYE